MNFDELNTTICFQNCDYKDLIEQLKKQKTPGKYPGVCC